MKINTVIKKMNALKEDYENALPYHRRKVVCTECGTEYARQETESDFIADMVKMCDCKADGEIRDLEAENE